MSRMIQHSCSEMLLMFADSVFCVGFWGFGVLDQSSSATIFKSLRLESFLACLLCCWFFCLFILCCFWYIMQAVSLLFNPKQAIHARPCCLRCRVAFSNPLSSLHPCVSIFKRCLLSSCFLSAVRTNLERTGNKTPINDWLFSNNYTVCTCDWKLKLYLF